MEKKINIKELQELVFNTEGISEHGLLDSEVKTLVAANFDEFNWDKYYDAMRGNTCMMHEGQIVSYHCDVFTGIRCGLENRSIRLSEWD